MSDEAKLAAVAGAVQATQAKQLTARAKALAESKAVAAAVAAVEAAKAKLAQAKKDAARQAIAARREAEAQERKRDARRKILIGAMMLEQIKQGRYTEDKLLQAMSGYLVRPDERALFDLAPLPEKTERQV
jgi:hypothetical protein